MSQFRHFLDRLFGFIFKVVVLVVLGGGGWLLFTGWGYKSWSPEEIADYEKTHNVKLTAEEKSQGFEGIGKLFAGIDETLTEAQVNSEQPTNMNKKKTDE